MAELPNFDEFLAGKKEPASIPDAIHIGDLRLQRQAAPAEDAQLPSFDEFLKGPEPSTYQRAKAAAGIVFSKQPNSDPAVAEFFDKTPAGRILGAFGGSVKESLTGGGDLGLDPEGDTVAALKKAGVFNDYAAGHVNAAKTANEVFMRPAAVALDAAWRGVNTLIQPPIAAIQQTANEIGGPVPELTEFLTTTAGSGATGLMHLPPRIAKARSLGVIGESEENYFGIQEPTPEQQIARDQAEASLPEKQTTLSTPVEPEPDIHTLARSHAPAVFKTYDDLIAQQTNLRRELETLTVERNQEAKAGDTLPHDDELNAVETQISTILGKVNGVETRLTKTKAAQLEDLRDQQKQLQNKKEELAPVHEALMAPDLEAVRTELHETRVTPHLEDTAQMQSIRTALQKNDYAMRDLAPQISEAYRKAERGESIQPQTLDSSAAEENVPKETPTKTPGENKAGVQDVATDVQTKLIAAGRPLEEAHAAAQLWAEHYKAVSDMGWAKGTPAEIYGRDAPNIAGREALRVQRAKGLFRTETDTIHLFEKADVSTFVHETGHAWLDEMMHYAAQPEAPEGLLKDRATVNKWLKVGEDGKIQRAQHEKFARGFERYLMEGKAPSKALAGVFEKFKQWLTGVYQTATKLRAPITDDIRGVFDRLLTANPETVGEQSENKAPIPNTESVKPEIQSGASIPNQTAVGRAVSENTLEGKESQNRVPTSPNAVIPKTETKFVDKAGNIRLDNLNTPEDINQVLRETADQNNNFTGARRGVVSDGEVLDLADAIGMEPGFLIKLLKRKVGEAFNAEQIVAARRMLIQSAVNVKELSFKAAAGEEMDLMAYAEARARHTMIQEHVSGITAEAGRALRAFRSLEGGMEAKALGEFLKKNTGLDLYQLQEEAKAVSTLETPQKISKLMNDSRKKTYRDKIVEYYINSLISGPITHARYSVGNALNALWTPLVEIPTAAGIGRVRELVTGVKTDRVYLGEAGAQLHAIMKGSRDGFSAAAMAFKTGVSPFLPTEGEVSLITPRLNAIEGKFGKAINIPSKSVAAIHSFFKSIRYEQNIQGLAYRAAMKEGLEPGSREFTNRLTQLSSSPTEEMMASATQDALKELYMTPTEYHSAMGGLTRFVNNNLAAKIIMPFMKIGSQITRNAFIERTPLGLLTEDVRNKSLYTQGAVKGDIQLAKMATGVGLMGITSLMVLEGMATGDGPADPSKRRTWLLDHHPNSLQIGDITIPYQGLGHLGMLMRFSANMTETAQGWEEEEGSKLAVAFMEGITRSVLDENFMRGLKDLLDAVYHPIEYGSSYIKQFATNWLPFSVGLGQVSRKVDPYQREAHSIFDAAQRRIPYISEYLEPRIDMFGEPIRNDNPNPYANDPVAQRMSDLQIGVGRVPKKIRGVELTSKQYTEFSELAGRDAKDQLNDYVALTKDIDLPAHVQIDAIHAIIRAARERARSTMMMNYPEIMDKAVQDKLEALED